MGRNNSIEQDKKQQKNAKSSGRSAEGNPKLTGPDRPAT